MEKIEVILVDSNDQPVGFMEKMQAHREGRLHRAFSVFIFNKKGQMLLQQRAAGKYHSGGLWTNACCSHPQRGEETLAAVNRRLKEELGFQVPVQKIFDFVYKTDFVEGLTEHEFDHVFVAEYEGPVEFDPQEVMSISYKDMNAITDELKKDPAQFTSWFHLAFPKVHEWWSRKYASSNSRSI